MILTTSSTIRIDSHSQSYEKFSQNPSKKEDASGQLLEGSFYQSKPLTVRAMLTRRINKSLCFCLLVTILVTFISYYIAMIYEAKLNVLDNQIVKINAENQDLQANLDKFRSFNNVDNRIGKFNLLQKADKVIEVTALTTQDATDEHQALSSNDNVNWAIGY